MRTGVAEFTLDYGRCPRWLFGRMVRLARAIGIAIIREFGPEEFLKRLADPVWFQSLGCVLAFDWNASGLTTTTLGALKVAFQGLEKDLGVFICGGKGKTSRKTPEEINSWGWRLGLNEKVVKRLEYSSRAAAKVDSALIQDGFQLYHHNFIFTKTGKWTVIQQGMNISRGRARRYHWLGDTKKKFIEEPHSGISSQIFLPTVLNLTSKKSRANRQVAVQLVRKPKTFLRDLKILTVKTKDWQFKFLSLPGTEFHHHPVERETLLSLESPQFRRAINQALIAQPTNFEKLLMTPGVGPKTIRAISLVAEIIYGAKPSYQDPARYTFAHGGKDGTPYFVNRQIYDQTLAIIEKAVKNTPGILQKEKTNLLFKAERFFGKV
ncbi:DUF763 domain-containing protein [bacterium]|nr:DUF763 domain-containing protein [bacterium]